LAVAKKARPALDMRGTCVHHFSMSGTIQIRDVPETLPPPEIARSAGGHVAVWLPA
jgi:hypothetical protein